VQEAKHLPLVLNVHGGPWARDVWGYRPDVQWFTNRGYAVLQVRLARHLMPAVEIGRQPER
jgi:dipeptidyl aminopeptidase/acylaminoacyl peptidase